MAVQPIYNEQLRIDKYMKYDPQNVEEVLSRYTKKEETEPVEIDCDRKPYPKLWVLAQFASDVYKNLHQEKIEHPQGWIQVVTGRNDSNNYYGAVFINVKEKQIIIAHRGTTMTMGSLKADIKSIVNNNISDHMLSAITFASRIIKALPSPGFRGNFYQVSFTGHSLGGWLAHVTAFTTKYLKKQAKDKVEVFVKDDNFQCNYHVHVVTFDNPGCYEMLEKLKTGTAPRYEEGGYGETTILDINSYLSAPNRINSCNKHIGKLFRTFPNFEEGPVPLKDNYNLISHRMENILNYLKCKANKKEIREVQDWPHKKPSFSFFNFFSFSKSGEYHQLFNELKSDNQYHIDKTNTALRYKAETVVTDKSFPLVVLTPREQQFLSNLNCLKHDTEFKDISDDYKLLLEFLDTPSNSYAKDVVKLLLLEMNIVMDKGRLSCQENKHLPIAVSVTKQLLFHLHTIYDLVIQQVKEIPSANQKFWKVLSKQHVQSLNRFRGFKFRKDIYGLEDFLYSEHMKFLIIASNQGECEMEKLYNVIDKDDNNIFISWSRIMAIDKNNLMGSLFNHKLIVVHFLDKEMKDIKILYEKLIEKAIVVCPYSPNLDKIEEQLDKDTFKIVKAGNVTIADLTVGSRQELLRRKIEFQGKIMKTLEELVQHDDTDVVARRTTFINKQNLEEFSPENDVLHVGQDLSLHTSLGVRFSKTCREIKNFETVVKEVKNSADSVQFLITGITEDEFENDYLKYFKIDERNRKKIIFAKEKNVDGVEYYQEICRNNMREKDSEVKTIYWLHVLHDHVHKDRKKIIWEQVYNTDFYINRKLVPRNLFINENFIALFAPSHNLNVKRETFIVRGSRNDFVNYLKTKIEDKDIAKKLDSIHNVIFEGEEELNEPKEKPIHKIELYKKENKFVCLWLSSDGSIKTLNSKIPMVENNYGKLLDETNLKSLLKERVVIIADEAGMGKTTLLTALAEQLVSEGEWVIRIDLNNLKNTVFEYSESGLDGFILFLQETIGDDFKKSLTKNMFEKDMYETLFKRVYLLMDAFDEIREKEAQTKIISFIKHIKQNTKINCWITTRNYTRDILEMELSTFGMSIEEIDEQKQNNYLRRCWRIGSSFTDTPIANEILTEMANKTLEQAKKLFGNDAKRFVGNPLHLRLMADALQTDINSYSAGGETPIYLDNIFKLYQKFLSNKFEIYFREKTDIRTELRSLLESHINTEFQEIAFKSRFPEEAKDFFGKKEIPDNLVEELHRIGLVRTKNSAMKVFHETFVDYYCATLIVHWLESHSKSPDIDEFLITKIFMKEDYTYIRHFINEQPTENAKKIAIENMWKTREHVFYNEHHETLFHILVREGQENLLNYAFDCCKTSHLGLVTPKVLSVRNVSGETPLYVAAKRDDKDILDKILREMNETCFKDGIEEIILASIFRTPSDGSDETVKEIRNAINNSEYNFVKDVLKDLEQMNFWHVIEMFMALLRENDVSLEKVKNKLQEMKTELQRKYLLLSRNSSWKTAVHIIAYTGNLDIIDYLLAAGAELEVYDKMKRTPLQNAVESKSLRAVKFLVERGHSVLAKDDTDMDALLKSAKLGLLDIMKYLLQKGADINSQDKCNINALLHAAKAGRLNVVKYLVEEKNMSVQHRDCFNITALSWAAQSKNNLEVVKYLVEEAGADKECRDKNGMTPLHHAAKKQNIHIVNYLLSKGCDINIPDRNKTSVLQRIIRCTGKKWAFVEDLLARENFRIDFNIHDGKSTPLQKALQDNKAEIVKRMINDGAKTDYLSDEENSKLNRIIGVDAEGDSSECYDTDDSDET